MLFNQEVKPCPQKSAIVCTTSLSVSWKSIERGEDCGAENHPYGYSFDHYGYEEKKKKKKSTECLCLIRPFHKLWGFLALEVKLRRGGVPNPWAAPWATSMWFWKEYTWNNHRLGLLARYRNLKFGMGVQINPQVSSSFVASFGLFASG